MDIREEMHARIVLDEVIDDGRFACNEHEWAGLLPVRRLALEAQPEQGSLIHFELWLPMQWNGIFLGGGNGGLAERVNYGTLVGYSKRGYAVAQGDLGTSLGVASGVGNPALWRDFGWRATHLMTVVSKDLLRTHYGKDADYSYFYGASTGGQQGLAMAQRFPEDYDGIIAGVPANNRVFLHTYFLWNYVHLRTREGRVLFAHEQLDSIANAAVDFFRARGDGESGDRFVTYPYTDEKTVADFLSYLGQRMPLTAEQRKALQAVYEGPVNPRTGEQIYNGIPIGAEPFGAFHEAERQGGVHLYPFLWGFGMDYDLHSFDFDRDLEILAQKLAPDLNANNPDLSAFAARGGKLIAFSGSADPIVPYPDFMNYYNRVCANMGGSSRVQEFFKYYLLPGKDHGVRGRGVNRWWLDDESGGVLQALRRWREQGVVPQDMTGVRIEQGEETLRRCVAPYASENNAQRPFPSCCDGRYLQM